MSKEQLRRLLAENEQLRRDLATLQEHVRSDAGSRAAARLVPLAVALADKTLALNDLLCRELEALRGHQGGESIEQ